MRALGLEGAHKTHKDCVLMASVPTEESSARKVRKCFVNLNGAKGKEYAKCSKLVDMYRWFQ